MRPSLTNGVDLRSPRVRDASRRLLVAVAATTAAILALALGSIAWESRVGAIDANGPSGSPRAIVVLPLRAASAGEDLVSIGIGLADALIARLSTVSGLSVRPLSAALNAGGADASPLEAGRALRAATVLSGAITRKDEGGLEVQVRLLDVATGAVLMARDLPAEPGDLIQLEERVVRETLAEVAPLAAGPGAAPARTGEPAARAHYLYLLARSRLATHESPAVKDAMHLLEEAVQADPSYARAHAALAQASAWMFLGGLSDQAAWLDRAVAEGRRAVLLDDRDPEAHRALGLALLASGDPVEATRETLLALKEDPENSEALRQLALLLAASGASEPAAHLEAQARLQDPSIELGWVDLWIALSEKRTAALIPGLEADAARRRRAGRSPEQPLMQLGYISFVTGDAGSGLRWAAMLDEVSDNLLFADMVRLLAYARSGDAATVERLIARNRRALWRDWEYCVWVAQALALVDRREEAIAWIERSVHLGAFTVDLFQTGDAFDALRTDQDFQKAFETVKSRAGEIKQLANYARYF